MDDDDSLVHNSMMDHLTVLDLPEVRELVDLVMPALEAAFDRKPRERVGSLVASELRRRLEAREIEASQEGLLRALSRALSDPAQAQLQAEIAAAVAARLPGSAQEAPTADIVGALTKLFAVKQEDRGYFMEVPREFSKLLGRLLLESVTRVEIDEEVEELLRLAGEFDTEATIQLLERDLAFVLHPLIAFRLVTWREAYIANKLDPEIPGVAREIDPSFAPRREANVERAERAAALLANPQLKGPRSIDPMNFRWTAILVKRLLQAVEFLWAEYQAKEPHRATIEAFTAALAPLASVGEEAMQALLRPRGTLLNAMAIELKRQYPGANVTAETLRKWLREFDDPDSDERTAGNGEQNR